MDFYYPDGNGGRRLLDTGGNTYNIDATQKGAVIFKGIINTLETYTTLLGKTGEVGDLWTLNFDDENNKIHAGDLLVWTGEVWQVLGTSPKRDVFTLPTASKSIKGGVVAGEGLGMLGDSINVTLEPYTLPSASVSVKGGVAVGKGLAMDGDFLNVTLDVPEPYTLPVASRTQSGGVKIGNGLYMDDGYLNVSLPSSSTAEETTEDKQRVITIKNVLKGGGGSGGSGGTGEFLLGTTPLTTEGAMWLSVPVEENDDNG